jgi:hypothetical protein
MAPGITLLSIALAAASLSGPVLSQVEDNPLRNLYFGETHMHTAYSLDAYIGGTRQMPADAYRAARGESVVVNARPHRIRRPLDFAAVTDHAEYIGEMYAALHPGSEGSDDPLIQQLLGLEGIEERQQWFFKYVVSNSRGDNPKHTPFFPGFGAVKNAWQLAIEAAEEYNDPGSFTSFVAYEWSAAPQGGNLHRNIIFRGDAHPEQPMSMLDIPREEGLWEWLAELEENGIRALAIPHNSNASKGMMFPDRDSTGKPIDSNYARQRQRFERAIEMMQVKGNSEVHRKFWAADEFADFENADSIQDSSGRTFAKGDFVRSGVIKGMKVEQALGINPFKLGFVGGTDNHNGMMGDVDEDNFAGAHGPEDSPVKQRREGSVTGWINSRELSIGALTAVWARSNTRAAIWDAMHARETYATSGPRIALRFFAGWDLDEGLHTRADAVEQGYLNGVPMGGDLGKHDGSRAPRFLVMTSKDPLGANLDRVQIVKGWVDAGGQLRDRVFDVTWSDRRKPGKDGRLPPVGNTVDLETATYLNSIGSAELTATWQDPDFDPALPALYYVRVLEIPTPRWTTYDAVRAGLPLLEDVPATIQERAWSSPIWYAP